MAKLQMLACAKGVTEMVKSPKHSARFFECNMSSVSSSGLPTTALLAMLQFLAPDEPVGPCERRILTPQRIPATSKKWPKTVFVTREKYPGYQPGYRYRENMKYGWRPTDDASLSEYMTAMINHAKAKGQCTSTVRAGSSSL